MKIRKEIDQLKRQRNMLQNYQKVKSSQIAGMSKIHDEDMEQQRLSTSNMYIEKNKIESEKKQKLGISFSLPQLIILEQQKQILQNLETNLVNKLKQTQNMHNTVFKQFKEIMKFRNTRAQELFT